MFKKVWKKFVDLIIFVMVYIINGEVVQVCTLTVFSASQVN